MVSARATKPDGGRFAGTSGRPVTPPGTTGKDLRDPARETLARLLPPDAPGAMHSEHRRTFAVDPLPSITPRPAEQAAQHNFPHLRQWCRLLSIVKGCSHSMQPATTKSGTQTGAVAASAPSSAAPVSRAWAAMAVRNSLSHESLATSDGYSKMNDLAADSSCRPNMDEPPDAVGATDVDTLAPVSDSVVGFTNIRLASVAGVQTVAALPIASYSDDCRARSPDGAPYRISSEKRKSTRRFGPLRHSLSTSPKRTNFRRGATTLDMGRAGVKARRTANSCSRFSRSRTNSLTSSASCDRRAAHTKSAFLSGWESGVTSCSSSNSMRYRGNRCTGMMRRLDRSSNVAGRLVSPAATAAAFSALTRSSSRASGALALADLAAIASIAC
mmetsp:Transcript_16086/g.50297  ORF Transcript_16086/g.50297 Transcript_16086/m.50297 type:complete len:386 (-) Transcript_16086:421-1578(-)